MTQKTFKYIRTLTAFFLAMVIAQAIVFDNYILAIVAIVGAVTVILTSRTKVKEVLVDERIILIGGKAARLTLSIFSVAGAGLTFILMFSRQFNPVFELIGSILAYSVCSVLLLYSLVFKYYENKE
jgi:uncharacterized membrane protein